MISDSRTGEAHAGGSQTVVVRVHVEHEDPDGYRAEVVELPGCRASGCTPQELNESLRQAIQVHLSTRENPVEVTRVAPPGLLVRQRSTGRHARPDEQMESRIVELMHR
jgi:predicted RNase H-like HicB family nuclease